MNDLRFGQHYESPVGQMIPLESRGPAWLSFSLGAIVSSAATAGIPAAALFFMGQSLSSIAVAGSGGFLLFCLAIALMLCGQDRRTGSNLLASAFGVGHTLLLGTLLAAMFVPGGKELAASVLSQVPVLSALPLAVGPMGAVAPLYLLAFVSFSVMVPLALIMFRYLALNRPAV